MSKYACRHSAGSVGAEVVEVVQPKSDEGEVDSEGGVRVKFHKEDVAKVGALRYRRDYWALQAGQSRASERRVGSVEAVAC